MTSKSTPPQENVDETPEVSALESVWEFIDKPATTDDVKALLATLAVPYSGGPEHDPITMDRYMPFVLPMTNKKKVKDERGADTWVMSTTLYTQVAGRLAILADVAERQGWQVVVEPEPVTPTGVPGYLQMNERLVFRVYVEIRTRTGELIGKRFGTAWSKSSGGFNAEGSNPYETVETSALGRALSQWGFGILPGSGIASVEEMRLARQNIGRPQSRGNAGSPPERVKEDRGDLIASAIDFMDRRRKMTGATQEKVDSGISQWIKDKFSIDGFVNDTGGYEWQLLTDAQISLLRNATRDAVVAAAAAGEDGQ